MKKTLLSVFIATLAWAARSQPVDVPWAELGGGVNGPVLAVLQGNEDTLVVVGQFTEAGGIPAQNVALWDGSTFSALGTGVSGNITSAAIIGNTIYIGGSALSNNYTDLATWNGTAWSYSTIFSGNFPQVRTLFAHDGTLYAGGIVSGFAGSDDVVKRLDNGNWTLLGSTLNNLINGLGWHNGQLVVGGEFTALQNGGGTNLNHVAVLNGGDWGPLGTGLPGTVNTLLDVDGSLYAAGNIKQNGSAQFGLARFPENGTAWEELMPNALDYINVGNPADAAVHALHYDGAHLFIGGDFHLEEGSTTGAHLARFNGTSDGFSPWADFNAPVSSLAHNSALGLIAAGELSQNGPDNMDHIAHTTLTTGLRPAPGTIAGIQLHPNPVQDQLFITLPAEAAAAASVDVFTMDGQRAAVPTTVSGTRACVDAGVLAQGCYLVRLTVNGVRTVLPFIKQ
ncbi:MAG: T9SS type A sorting domain-containing protein [Flavobacteriales bacterium]|nr:T9SS type A sorting domain-containing protein [Flavobacteriales bacterium]